MRPGLVALGLTVALVGSGCQYLLGLDPYAVPEDWDEFADPAPTATFRSGSASIAIAGGDAVELPRLTAPGALYDTFGGMVTFTNDTGWYLQIIDMSAAPSMGLGSMAYLSLDRIVGTSHWTSADPSRCIVTITKADETGLLGTATCKGLRWADMFANDYYATEPSYIDGEAPFDAEITFEAVPGPAQT
jgi:hypothetical protein